MTKLATRLAAVVLPVAATGAMVAPAHADTAAPATPHHHRGALCGVNNPEVIEFAAGVEELTTGTLNCAVNGTRDVLGSLGDVLGDHYRDGWR